MKLFESLIVSMAFLMIQEQQMWMSTVDLTAVKYSLGLLDVVPCRLVYGYSISEEPVAFVFSAVAVHRPSVL
jgi:hypothetical protein